MVPSWTESLLVCGVQVVGRTRFCIHPEAAVKNIPAVGGTKNWDLSLVRDLNADFILLDKEENPKEMFAADPDKCVVTHVERVEDVGPALKILSQKFENKNLLEMSERWEAVARRPIKKRLPHEIPGIIDWIKRPNTQADNSELRYVIWKNPWMAVSPETFIGSQLTHLGFGDSLSRHEKKYYEFELKQISKSTIFLFSTEPYPFHKKRSDLEKLDFASAIINGEDYSWFGIRALEFLEKNK